jgi:hypothetical protein
MDGKSRGTSFCDVTQAVSPIFRPYVVVAGSGVAYSPISLNASSGDLIVTVVGPGKASTYPATIASTDTSSAVYVLAMNNHNATLALDGFHISSAGGDAVFCPPNGGTATLAIVDSAIEKSGGAGVNALRCTVRLDRDLVDGNAGPGLHLDTGTSYSVTNTIVFGNGGGVTIATSATGDFRFDTVAMNMAAAGPFGGITCSGSTARLVEDSIVWGNATSGGTQIAGSCKLSNVVTGNDTFTGAVRLDPSFVNPTATGDFHLKPMDAANGACCVDKVTAGDGGATMLPARDVDGSHRPKGAGWDIGAHEVE